MFVQEPKGDMPVFEIRTKSECHFEAEEITVKTIESRLKNLIETKSLGVDGQHPRVLKNCAVAFAFSLMIIFYNNILSLAAQYQNSGRDQMLHRSLNKVLN